MIQIHRKKKSVKKTMPGYTWDEKILNKVCLAASKMTYAELVLFWLKEKTHNTSEKETKKMDG